MLNVDKIRLWHVQFIRNLHMNTMPYPSMIVEELEEPGYHMPQFAPTRIPVESGGQITVTLAGRGILNVGKRKFDCLPGTAFLYQDRDPDVSYCCPSDGEGKWRFIWINFMGEAASRIIAETNEIYGYHFYVGKNSRIENALTGYRKYAGTTFLQSPWEAAVMFSEMLSALCCPEERKFKQTRKSRQMLDIQTEIRNAFNESLTTAMLAKRLGITRGHLSASFRMKTGRTLRDYREELRLQEALTLLLKSNLTCKEIASLSHYGSYSSFFRAFKKKYLVSPEMFREKNL